MRILAFIAAAGMIAAPAFGAAPQHLWFTFSPNETACIDLPAFSRAVGVSIPDPKAWADDMRMNGYLVGFRTARGFLGDPIVEIKTSNPQTGREIGFRVFFGANGDCVVALHQLQSEGDAPSAGDLR